MEGLGQNGTNCKPFSPNEVVANNDLIDQPKAVKKLYCM